MVSNCIFCKICKGEIPCNKVYEDKNILAFLDINPATDKGGHTLVMPKKHYELIIDISEKELQDLIKVVQKISKVLLKLYPGLNILENNKRIAGQVIPHLHFHLIPRYEKDNIKIDYWETHKYGPEEDIKLANKIKRLLK